MAARWQNQRTLAWLKLVIVIALVAVFVAFPLWASRRFVRPAEVIGVIAYPIIKLVQGAASGLKRPGAMNGRRNHPHRKTLRRPI